MNTDIIAIQASDLSSLMSAVNEIKTTMSEKNEQIRKHIYRTPEWVCKTYNISQRTLQTYRDRRLIPFSQIGQKIWFSQADLDQFFANHRIK